MSKSLDKSLDKQRCDELIAKLYNSIAISEAKNSEIIENEVKDESVAATSAAATATATATATAAATASKAIKTLSDIIPPIYTDDYDYDGGDYFEIEGNSLPKEYLNKEIDKETGLPIFISNESTQENAPEIIHNGTKINYTVLLLNYVYDWTFWHNPDHKTYNILIGKTVDQYFMKINNDIYYFDTGDKLNLFMFDTINDDDKAYQLIRAIMTVQVIQILLSSKSKSRISIISHADYEDNSTYDLLTTLKDYPNDEIGTKIFYRK